MLFGWLCVSRNRGRACVELIFCVCSGESQGTRGAGCGAGAAGPHRAPGLRFGHSQRSVSECWRLCGSSGDNVLN